MSPKAHLPSPRLKLDWEEGRTERLLASVHTRLDRRKRALRGAVAVATVASMVGVGLVTFRTSRAPTVASSSIDAPRPATAHGSIRLADGSQIEVDPSTSEVRVVAESASHVAVDVIRGMGRYAVVPSSNRTFEVRCGSVTVTVIGTEFVVDRRGEKTWVEVLRGKVRVAWGNQQALLETGESGTFPREAIASATEDGLTAREEIDTKSARSAQPMQVYRSRVARRDYHGAYAVLARNPTLAGDTVEDLLVAADVARLSSHPSEAVPYLHKIIREHPRDERAPLAAFTLGRTLSGLGRTEEAMNMFGRVKSAWPTSPLAEDAMIRQAEAASQLGDWRTARRIAEQYDRDYPNGHRRSEVRRHARLE